MDHAFNRNRYEVRGEIACTCGRKFKTLRGVWSHVTRADKSRLPR